MEIITISTDYIKLDQFLKWAGVSENGALSKVLILDGKVKVNDQVELQRGKKIRDGDKVEIGKSEFLVKKI